MAGRKHSRDQFLSPKITKMPEVFVIQDYSVSPTSQSQITCANATFGAFLSPGSIDSLYRRSNSTVSSIFDLSIESDQLDRALRENDVNAVTKFLQVHNGKFPICGQLSPRYSDQYSNESRSRRPSSRASGQDGDLFNFRRFPFSHGDRLDIERRESVTPEWDIPDIFRTSIHVAITHGSNDVIKVLLKFGVDPNVPRESLLNYERRPSSFTQDPDWTIEEMTEPYGADEGQGKQFLNRNTLTVPSFFTHHHLTVPSATLSPPPLRSPPITLEVPKLDNTTEPSDTCKPDKPRASFAIGSDSEYGYTIEELYRLPPLFYAVHDKQVGALRLLLEYGADPNVQDKVGNTPLHLAAAESYYDNDICRGLLAASAKIKQSNKQGVTPFDVRPSLADLQVVVIKDMLSGKSSTYSLNKTLDSMRVGGKRISLSSNSDSNSRSFGRAGSIKKKLFKRGESRERERQAREKRRNERLESTSTGTGMCIYLQEFLFKPFPNMDSMQPATHQKIFTKSLTLRNL